MINEIIRKRRTVLGLKQKNLGEMIGISEKAVSKIETGKNQVDIQHVPAIAKALHLPYITLLQEYSPIVSEKDNYSKRFVQLIPVNVIKHITSSVHEAEVFAEGNPDNHIYAMKAKYSQIIANLVPHHVVLVEMTEEEMALTNMLADYTGSSLCNAELINIVIQLTNMRRVNFIKERSSDKVAQQ